MSMYKYNSEKVFKIDRGHEGQYIEGDTIGIDMPKGSVSLTWIEGGGISIEVYDCGKEVKGATVRTSVNEMFVPMENLEVQASE